MADFYGFAILFKNEICLLKEIKNKNRNKNKNLKISENDLNEVSIKLNNCYGFPTTMSLCNYTKSVYIGYSNGSIEKYNSQIFDNKKEKIKNKLNSRFLPLLFDTSTIHACAIRKLLIIRLPQPPTSRLQIISNQVLVLLVCDDSGIISVWKIDDKNLETEIRYYFVFCYYDFCCVIIFSFSIFL